MEEFDGISFVYVRVTGEDDYCLKHGDEILTNYRLQPDEENGTTMVLGRQCGCPAHDWKRQFVFFNTYFKSRMDVLEVAHSAVEPRQGPACYEWSRNEFDSHIRKLLRLESNEWWIDCCSISIDTLG